MDDPVCIKFWIMQTNLQWQKEDTDIRKFLEIIFTILIVVNFQGCMHTSTFIKLYTTKCANIYPLHFNKVRNYHYCTFLYIIFFPSTWRMHKEIPNQLLLLLLLQSCQTLCNPIDGSLPGSSVPGILQARILELVAISFSNACIHAKLPQSCLTLGDPMDSSPPGSSVYRIL